MLLWLAEKWDNPVFLREMRRRRLRPWLTAGGLLSLAAVIAGPTTPLPYPVYFALLPSWPILLAGVPAAIATTAIALGARGSEHEHAALRSRTLLAGQVAAGGIAFLPAALVGVTLAALRVADLGGAPPISSYGAALCSVAWCASLTLASPLASQRVARGAGSQAGAHCGALLGLLVAGLAIATAVLVRMSLPDLWVRTTAIPAVQSAWRVWLLSAGWAAFLLGAEFVLFSGPGRWVVDRGRIFLRAGRRTGD